MSANALTKFYACPSCDTRMSLFMPKCPLCGTSLDRTDGSRAIDDGSYDDFGGPTPVVTHRELLLGSNRASDYIIEKRIGQGGMGLVYRARHRSSGRQVAIKILRREYAAHARMRRRFMREAEALSLLSHPNLVSLVDCGETADGMLYLVMPYIAGKDVTALISDGPVSAARIIDLMKQLCAGLAHAHAQGVVHCDLKPGNILLSRHGDRDTVHILDFGLALIQSGDEDDRSEEFVLATPRYMAPEQGGGHRMDHRVDLFALGLVLYELLAGVPPFAGDPIEVATMNCLAPPPRIAARRPGLTVNPHLEAIAMRLMAKKPERRYQSAGEVLQALEALEAFERCARSVGVGLSSDSAKPAVAALPTLPLRPAPPRHREPITRIPLHRSRSVVWPLIGVVLAVVLAAALGMYHQAHSQMRPDQEPEAPTAACYDSDLEALFADITTGESEQALPMPGARL